MMLFSNNTFHENRYHESHNFLKGENKLVPVLYTIHIDLDKFAQNISPAEP
jgi:hypothetical protein